MGVKAKGIPRACLGEFSFFLILGIPTVSFQLKTLLLESFTVVDFLIVQMDDHFSILMFDKLNLSNYVQFFEHTMKKNYKKMIKKLKCVGEDV